MTIFKLKKANAITRFAIFTSPPSWGDLATRISGLFNIPVEDILVVYIRNKTPAALSNDEELQNFYKKNQTDGEIKFVVQDQENIDSGSAVDFQYLNVSHSLPRNRHSHNHLDLVCRFGSIRVIQ